MTASVARIAPLDRITLRMADITLLAVDAIVNAANNSLQGGGGIDGMIHWAAGSGLGEACRQIGWCPTGEARITGGYNLPARYVIHTVGPVHGIEREKAPELLASCYRNCCALAEEYGLRTIAFPAISCGAYGYPVASACRIALNTVCTVLERQALPEQVLFVVYTCRDYEAYTAYYEEKRSTGAHPPCGDSHGT